MSKQAFQPPFGELDQVQQFTLADGVAISIGYSRKLRDESGEPRLVCALEGHWPYNAVPLTLHESAYLLRLLEQLTEGCARLRRRRDPKANARWLAEISRLRPVRRRSRR